MLLEEIEAWSNRSFGRGSPGGMESERIIVRAAADRIRRVGVHWTQPSIVVRNAVATNGTLV